MLGAIEERGVLRLRAGRAGEIGPTLPTLAWDLVNTCERVNGSDEGSAGVVLECAGASFFVAPPFSANDCDAAAACWGQATSAIAGLAQPTVAVIAGDAIGPSWELALACDLRICAEGARVGSPEIRWGRIPAAGGTQRLARLAGPGRAMWLLMRGEILTAEDAERFGLVHRVVPASDLASCVDRVLDRLRASAPVALAYAKEAALSGSELPLANGLRLEADLASLLQTTADRSEGVRAFLERRRPRFQGR